MNAKERDLFLKRLSEEQMNAGILHVGKNKETDQIEKLELDKLELDIESQLFIAILLSPLETVQNLLERGADPNATNRKGTTLLQLALAFQREDVAHLLLEYGATPTIGKNKKFKKK